MQGTYSILISLLAAATLTACGMSTKPREGQIGKLSKQDQKVLEIINENMTDHIAAREKAVFKFVATPVSKKAELMSGKIGENCENEGVIPDKDIVGGMNHQTINGGNCPIYWYRQRGITSVNTTRKILRIIDKLSINPDEKFREFADLSGLKMRYADGVIESITNGVDTHITGNVGFNGYEIAGLGSISVIIKTDQTFEGDEGEGWISITVTTSGGQNTGWITWKIRRNIMQKPTYMVDNSQVEEKDFGRLFSSFELGKIMDSSERMK